MPLWALQGTHEALEEARIKETPQEAAARLKQQSADTKNAVMCVGKLFLLYVAVDLLLPLAVMVAHRSRHGRCVAERGG